MTDLEGKSITFCVFNGNIWCFYVLLLQEVGAKKDRLDFEQFHKLYNHIMFEQNEVSQNYHNKVIKYVLFRILYIFYLAFSFILIQILDEFKKESCAFILG